jgi:phosphoribosylformimino-5-aminoimidazole carboxamide ribotide isomerase
MILYPAMDLIGGRAVRLEQGRFDAATAYPGDPRDALARFAEAGATWAHVVDLDGARAGRPAQHDLLASLAAEAPLKLQVAGGLRTADQIARLIDAGVGRVVIGSLAVLDPELVGRFFERFGAERIALALDVRVDAGTPRVLTRGWTEDGGRTLWDVASCFAALRHLLVTDVSRDGMLGGPNFELLEEVVARCPGAAVQASGGVSSIADLKRLRTPAAIVGKALWEGRIDLAEAVRACA